MTEPMAAQPIKVTRLARRAAKLSGSKIRARILMADCYGGFFIAWRLLKQRMALAQLWMPINAFAIYYSYIANSIGD
jgi:hypothetical protein